MQYVRISGLPRVITAILGALVVAILVAGIAISDIRRHRSAASPRACALAARDLGAFVNIAGGGFIMGRDALYPEEGPAEKVFVSPFRLHVHEVTNSQFAQFVAATGYVTDAEKNGGSAQFEARANAGDFLSWWKLDPQATWRAPHGAGSNLDGRGLYPVVHVTLNDARAYADWAGGRIPTEVEWEYAASLGLFDPNNPFSGAIGPDGEPRANIWTGLFPTDDTGRDGYAGAAPVGCFEPARTGAYDMIGNVWEWTESPFASAAPRFTIKGGSFLCSENYCRRYRAAAREDLERDFSTAHVGFRIVKDRE